MPSGGFVFLQCPAMDSNALMVTTCHHMLTECLTLTWFAKGTCWEEEQQDLSSTLETLEWTAFLKGLLTNRLELSMHFFTQLPGFPTDLSKSFELVMLLRDFLNGATITETNYNIKPIKLHNLASIPRESQRQKICLIPSRRVVIITAGAFEELGG